MLVHSGGRSVVGNSRVEEHISKQALTDVYELKQHSQEPANIVENKMEVRVIDSVVEANDKLTSPVIDPIIS